MISPDRPVEQADARAARSGPSAEKRRSEPWVHNIRSGVLVIAIISAAVAATAGCAPVGSPTTDRVLTAAAAFAVTFAAANASTVAIVIAAAAVTAAGGSWQLHVVGLVTLAAAAMLERYERARPTAPIARGVLGAVVVQSLLRLPFTSPARGSAVLALVVMAVLVVSGLRFAPRIVRRRVVAAATLVFAVALLATIASVYVVLRSRTLLETGEATARAGVDAARNGDRVGAVSQFGEAEHRFADARAKLDSWLTFPARQLPIVGPQLRALDSIALLGTQTIPIARSTATRIDPDRLRLSGGRLDLAVLASYRPIFDQLAQQTSKVRAQLHRLPRMWLVTPLETQLVKFEKTVIRADDTARTADEAVRLAPALLGASGTRTYLVAFVTPAEARGSGGLMANYGVLTASHGRVHLLGVGRGPDLDGEGIQPKHLTGPPDYLARYDKFEPASTWENVTMSPDFPSVAEVMAQLYPQSGGVRLDGVIQVDPFALARMLALTGPVTVPGLPVTIDENNAVSFLLRDEYTIITDPIRRSNLLGDVAKAVFNQLTSGTSARPSTIAQQMSPAVDTRDLALWFADPTEETFARDIGADDALPPVRGDSFGVFVQNGGGSKIDNYLQRTIRYTPDISGADGQVRARAVVVLHNSSPATGVPLYVIGNSIGRPPGTSTLYVSVFSPLGLRGATVDGRPVKLLAERELGRNTYSAYVDIPPGGTRTLALDLAGTVDLSAGDYHFDYLAQVLPNADRVEWNGHVLGAGIEATTAGGAGRPAVDRVSRSSAVAQSADRGPWSVDLWLHR